MIEALQNLYSYLLQGNRLDADYQNVIDNNLTELLARW